MSQPATTTRLHRSESLATVARKSDILGSTACASLQRSKFARTPRGSSGARGCACLASKPLISEALSPPTPPGLTTLRFGGADG
jgi:hypothetical protein